jgi:2-C-methyl-D-erythritol 2,4-cyclodiphosphate synthase
MHSPKNTRWPRELQHALRGQEKAHGRATTRRKSDSFDKKLCTAEVLRAGMVGIGYDVHRLVEGKRLVLGGVEIPSSKGVLAHSDGDVVLHALCDALLGAAGLGDIGEHFPDSDPAYREADSRELLRQVVALVEGSGYRIVNVDVTLVLQEPKIAPYREQMRRTIAALCRLPCERVSVKATTPEHLGFVGRGEGVAALCVCELQPLP